MTPTRALVGLAAVAAAGYAVITGVGEQDPQYIGDFPSIQEQSQTVAPQVAHDAGAPQPGDPQHYPAAPVAPQAAPADPGGPAGPGPLPPTGTAGGGGTGGQGGYPPAGPGNPLSDGLGQLTDLLSGLTGSLPTLDPQGFCRLASGQLVALPCDQIPALPSPTLPLP